MLESLLAFLAFLAFMFCVFVSVVGVVVLFQWRRLRTPIPPLGLGLATPPIQPLGLGLATPPIQPLSLDLATPAVPSLGLLPSPPCMSCRITKKILQDYLLAKKIKRFEREIERIVLLENHDQDFIAFLNRELQKLYTERNVLLSEI